MATPTAAVLARLPLFADVPADSLARVEAFAERVELPARRFLFRADEPATTLYVVLSGRLQVVAADGRVLRDIGPGSMLGELAVLAGTARSASVRALRDSELLSVERSRFEAVLEEDRHLGLALLRRLASQLQESSGLAQPESQPAVFAVVPLATPPLPEEMWDELRNAFGQLGSVATLDGVAARDPSHARRALAHLEDENERVLVLAEGSEDWRSFVLRQADRVLLVAGSEPPATLDERLLGGELLFAAGRPRGGVGAWLDAFRPRAHHLLEPQARKNGTLRAVRRMTGNALGLVLSGGGARGFAHIGALDVLHREGFAPDRVGGCSIGAFIGAMAACGWDAARMRDVCHDEFVKRSPFSDYTLPRVSLIRARRAASMLRRVFGETLLEELPRPLYTVSADLISSQLVVHRRGPLWEAVGASMSIPGLAPPHPLGSQLLVDGGVLNNLPVDLMAQGEGPIVAIDVIRKPEAAEEDDHPTLPTIMETLSRATVLGSVERAERNRALAALTIVPDVQDIALRAFSQLDRAIEAGRVAALAALEGGGRDRLRAALRD